MKVLVFLWCHQSIHAVMMSFSSVSRVNNHISASGDWLRNHQENRGPVNNSTHMTGNVCGQLYPGISLNLTMHDYVAIVAFSIVFTLLSTTLSLQTSCLFLGHNPPVENHCNKTHIKTQSGFKKVSANSQSTNDHGSYKRSWTNR